MTYQIIAHFPTGPEVVDEFDDKAEALSMVGEYAMAFMTPITIKECRKQTGE